MNVVGLLTLKPPVWSRPSEDSELFLPRWDPEDSFTPSLCPWCAGTGACDQCYGSGFLVGGFVCAWCGGAGKCHLCGGAGTLPEHVDTISQDQLRLLVGKRHAHVPIPDGHSPA